MTYLNLTVEQVAKMFNVSVEQIKQQCANNAKVFETMHAKAIKTGKKVNGYSASQLETLINEYRQKAI